MSGSARWLLATLTLSKAHCQPKWPWGAVGYQIYPRSFSDSDNDGIGDLRGITGKLDYLNNGFGGGLGVDTVWICPFYKSPMVDFGYDIVDHCAVDPVFGSLEDFDEMILQSHRRGIKVLVDFVPNHTSNMHPWFLESRSSRVNEKRDWYVWRDRSNGGPPNNWLSVFGGSAWEFDSETGQYYLHSFLKQQPDLNWENPDVVCAMLNVLKFWLDRGIDGVRVDAVSWISKDCLFRDDPVNPDFRAGMDPYHKLVHLNSKDGSQVFPRLRKIGKFLRSYGGKFMITESYPDIRADALKYLEFHNSCRSNASPFNFELIFLPWKASEYKRYIDNFHLGLKEHDLPVFVYGNLDRPRLAGRVGSKNLRVAAMLLLTLPGVPFIYYGDEIGMSDAFIPKSKLQDPAGRDPQRTPMQWSGAAYAGFSGNAPWLPINDDYKDINVAKQLSDPRSLLNLYRELIKYRKASKALCLGSYAPVDLGSAGVFAFIREYRGEKLLVALNFTRRRSSVHKLGRQAKIRLSTHPGGLRDGSGLEFRPYEGIVAVLG